MPLPDGLSEPVSLDDAKARLGIRTAARDAEIQQLIGAAREMVEDYSGHILVRRSVTRQSPLPLSGSTPVRLHVEPVHALESFAILERDGTSTAVLDAVLLGGVVLPADGSAWLDAPYGFSVTVDAGYDIGEEPAQLIQAMLLLVGHWFEHHEAVVVGTSAVELPLGVKALCQNFRTPGFE